MDAKVGNMMCKLKGRMGTDGDYDVEMKGLMETVEDVQIKRAMD